MRVPLPGIWPTSPSYEGALFFGQLVNEMVFDYAADSYRAPSLNTNYRLIEARQVTKNVIENNLNHQIVDPVREEAIWSLRSDLVAKEIFGPDLPHTVAMLERANTPPDFQRIATYIHRQIESRYFPTCKELIRTVAKDPRRKQDLYSLAESFVSHVLNYGYSRQWLYYQSNRFFFPNYVISALPETLLDQFLEAFPLSNKKFKIYFWIAAGFAKFLPSVRIGLDRVDPATEPLSEQPLVGRFFYPRQNCELWCLTEIEAPDCHRARANAEEFLNLARSIVYTVHIEDDLTWLSEMCVTSDDGPVIVTAPVDALLRRIRLPLNLQASAVREKTDAVFGRKLNVESIHRLIRSITTYSGAFQTTRLETQFVNLWSSLEVLLPAVSNGPRIVTYIKYLIPTLMHRYRREMFGFLFDDLRRCYRNRFLDIISAEPLGTNLLEKFAATVVLPSRRPQLERIFELCNDNPLGRYRLFRLAQAHETIRESRKFLQKHRGKLTWQVHRIYRARNDLVHSGTRLPFLESLLMNLHEYLVLVLREVDHRSGPRRPTGTLDSIFDEIFFDDEIYETALKQFEPELQITEASLMKMLRFE